jgi:hypothetical protein
MKKIIAALGVAFLLSASLAFAPVRHVAAQSFSQFTSMQLINSLIDATPIGSNTPSTGVFSELSSMGFNTATSQQGAYLGWNMEVAGETDFVNLAGTGPGGYRWKTGVNGSSLVNVMTLTPTGVLSVGGNFQGPLTGNVTGNSSTASGSDHTINPCAANQYVTGLSTVWALTCTGAVTSFNSRSGVVTLQAGDVNGVGSITNSTSGNAATATQFAATPSQCAANTYAGGIAANGNANCDGKIIQSASGTGCSTGASSFDTCDSGPVTWQTPFPDTNYQVSCTAISPSAAQTGCSGGGGCQLGTISGVTKSTSSVTVIWATMGGNIATAASFDCTARHN